MLKDNNQNYTAISVNISNSKPLGDIPEHQYQTTDEITFIWLQKPLLSDESWQTLIMV